MNNKKPSRLSTILSMNETLDFSCDIDKGPIENLVSLKSESSSIR